MTLIDRLVENPYTFHYLRKIAEANYRATKRRMLDLLDPDAPTLDLGCGTGEFAPLFRAEGYVGIDISLPYLRFAKRRMPRYGFALAQGQELPLADGSVGQVLINGVLHHLGEELARRLVGEARRVLRSGGRLLLIEDIEPERPPLTTRLIHAMDAGEHIRARQDYPDLLEGDLEIEREEEYRSGLCVYGLWLARRR
ncbi:MAG: methyltransferase domain-containing protein [Candidatus Eisenbacteria bacterium]|nr:methyltransferase domain-containing protein [Candidatus Latescibacterota bacterium]MBD3301847.1 methyltransferase domain-containing protein [Candidatus Eisenbacteria bacterium]